MTVSAQTPINRSTGNGVTTVFAYTFKILNKADILVTVDGVAKTVDVDYTVSGVGVEGGGNVTFSVAPDNLTSVVRRRAMQLTRATDYQDQGELPAGTLDDDLDRAILMIQQVDEEVGRSLVLPAGVVGVSAELPAPVGGSFLGWNTAGDAIQNYAGLASTPVSLAMAPVVAAATLEAARMAMGTPEASQKLTATLATVGGTATAITATQAPATSGVKVVDLIVAAGNGAAATTLAVNGDAAKNVKAYDGAGAKVNTPLVAGQRCRFFDDGVDWVLANPLPVVNIASFAEDTAPDANADYLAMYDASSGANKKVLFGRLGGPTLGAAVATTSGTSIDFTGIPAWAKRVVLKLSGVAMNASTPAVKIGPVAGVESTGYYGSSGYQTTGVATTQLNNAAGFNLVAGAAGNLHYGAFTFELIDAASNLWAVTAAVGVSNSQIQHYLAGTKSIAGLLSVVRLTSVSGAGVFTAGSASISWE